MSNKLTAVVKYKDPIVSSDINKARIGFFPKGRYFGFDLLIDSGSTGFSLELRNSNKLKFTDENGVTKEVGLAVSPHGVIIHYDDSDGGFIFQVVSTTEDKYYLLAIHAVWTQSVPSMIPYFYIKIINNMNQLDQWVNDPLHDIAIGAIKVKANATNASGVELYPAEVPNFAAKPLPDYEEIFMSLHNHNLVTKTQLYTYDHLDESSFNTAGGIVSMLTIPNTNFASLVLTESKAINYLETPFIGSLANKSSVFFLEITANSNPYTLTLYNTGNIKFPSNSIVLTAGDVIILTHFNGIYKVVGFYNDFSRNGALKTSSNVWDKPQVLKALSYDISDLVLNSVLYLPDVMLPIIDLNTIQTIDSIRVNHLIPLIGTSFNLILTDNNNTHNKLTLRLSQKDEFKINDSPNRYNQVYLMAGLYTFIPIKHINNSSVRWFVSGNFNGAKYDDTDIVYFDNYSIEINNVVYGYFTLKSHRKDNVVTIFSKLEITLTNLPQGYILTPNIALEQYFKNTTLELGINSIEAGIYAYSDRIWVVLDSFNNRVKIYNNAAQFGGTIVFAGSLSLIID